MIRLKLKLSPKNHIPISLNYKYYLASICDNLMKSCGEDFDEKLKRYNLEYNAAKAELLTFTQFFCSDYEIKDRKILFKEVINWYISSPVYELILHIVQKLYSSNSIKISNEEFEILSFEATEIEDSAVAEVNKGNFNIPSERVNELLEKLDNYYILSKDEMII